MTRLGQMHIPGERKICTLLENVSQVIVEIVVANTPWYQNCGKCYRYTTNYGTPHVSQVIVAIVVANKPWYDKMWRQHSLAATLSSQRQK